MEETLIIIGIIVGLFFLFRGLQTWYWKIDARMDQQRMIIRLLSKIADSKGLLSEDEKKEVEKMSK